MSEAPHAAAVFAGQDEQDRAGAAAVAGVPAAAAFMALAGTQMGRQIVCAGMAGQVSQSRRPSGHRLYGLPAR
ncbi:MAG TPA: hypothetical protein DEQ61_10975 [Streptomyces sp.]|nr:hypothetical protein [Streptomyces sp.]